MALVEVMLWGVERMSRTSPWGRMGVDMPADVNPSRREKLGRIPPA
jgi:hypothetical protein